MNRHAIARLGVAFGALRLFRRPRRVSFLPQSTPLGALSLFAFPLGSSLGAPRVALGFGHGQRHGHADGTRRLVVVPEFVSLQRLHRAGGFLGVGESDEAGGHGSRVGDKLGGLDVAVREEELGELRGVELLGEVLDVEVDGGGGGGATAGFAFAGVELAALLVAGGGGGGVAVARGSRAGSGGARGGVAAGPGRSRGGGGEGVRGVVGDVPAGASHLGGGGGGGGVVAGGRRGASRVVHRARPGRRVVRAGRVEAGGARGVGGVAGRVRGLAGRVRVRAIRPGRVLALALVASALGPAEAPKPSDGGAIPLAGTAGAARTASERQVPGERRRTAEQTTGDRPGDASERHGDPRRRSSPRSART